MRGKPAPRVSITTFGDVDAWSDTQLRTCLTAAEALEGGELHGVLCADHHPGYSQPIGGVVAYRNHVSPSGVGYDIACGNLAAKTNIRYEAVRGDVPRIMDEVWACVSFGMGRKNPERVDHAVLDDIAHSPVSGQRGMARLARSQLGTVGGGNHYVDLFSDEDGWVWIGVHFGSRGFGHRTCTGFLALAQNRRWEERVTGGGMDTPPILLDMRTNLGIDYVAAREIAGRYAYAGREWVVDRVAVLGSCRFARPGTTAGATRAVRSAGPRRRSTGRVRSCAPAWWTPRLRCALAVSNYAARGPTRHRRSTSDCRMCWRPMGTRFGCCTRCRRSGWRWQASRSSIRTKTERQSRD